MNRVKEDDLVYIEKCFTAIKNKVGINDNLNKISLALKRLFEIDCTLNIVDNTTNEFFGMNVFPSVSTMDLMIESIVTKQSTVDDILKIWKKNEEWHIEIDSILLYDTNLNSNPQELVAVLLHEIGHIVYSNSVPQRLHKIIKFKIIKMNYQMKQLISTEKIRKLFNIAIVESCSAKNYNYVDIKTEKVADKFVIRYGYGQSLDEFIDKLIKSQGNSLVNRTETEVENEINIVVNWTVLNLKELEFRKKSLRTNLKVEILKSPSILTKKIIQDIYNSFFGESNDKYRVLLSEQAGYEDDRYEELRSYQMLDTFVKRVLTEASNNIFDKHGKLKKITQNDIDILAVEAEKIDTIDDKIYLLDKLYSQVELVNMGLDYIASEDKNLNSRITQSKRTLLDMKDQLEEIRQQILATKIIEKEYGVFIKYPRGYQG